MVKPMTPAQKQLAENHMDLVPKIIRSLTNGSPLTSEQRQELCQIGYLSSFPPKEKSQILSFLRFLILLKIIMD